jgi:hypothetical protein
MNGSFIPPKPIVQYTALASCYSRFRYTSPIAPVVYLSSPITSPHHLPTSPPSLPATHDSGTPIIYHPCPILVATIASTRQLVLPPHPPSPHPLSLNLTPRSLLLTIQVSHYLSFSSLSLPSRCIVFSPIIAHHHLASLITPPHCPRLLPSLPLFMPI